jgi:hypothetical protein
MGRSFWETLFPVNRPLIRRIAVIGHPLLPALGIFGLLFMTRMFGTAPENGLPLVKIGAGMLWLALFFLIAIIGDLRLRVEDLEKKAGIRK